MNSLIISVVLALCVVESGGKPDPPNGACGGEGILQFTPIMQREYIRLNGRLPSNSHRNPALARQMAHTILSERLKRREAQRPFTSDMERVRFMCGIWNPGGGYEYFEKIITTLNYHRIHYE